jgi:hypothetical protein
MASKAKIGDILEIPTRKGLAYVQFSHYHEPAPHMGAIIRVLPGFSRERPKDLQSLADQKELYYTFFPVQAAVNRKIFQIAGHADVPKHAKNFPLFRSGNINPQTGTVDQWWLWDGTKSWKIGKLTDEQLDLSIESGWNDVLLVSRIEQGWTPRKAEAFIQAARLRKKVQKAPTVKGVRHFLLFKSKNAAEHAQRLANDAGFKSEIVDSGPEVKAILTVQQDAPLTEEYIEHVAVQLAEIAGKTSGTYDAWEASLTDSNDGR